METMKVYIVPAEKILEIIDKLLEREFDLNQPESRQIAISRLNDFLQNSKPGIYCCIEYPYVDILYRNEYYHFFSSKLYDYKRDCIRLSFFNMAITDADFRDINRIEYLQENFLGFLVVRPTFPSLIGRNVLSPNFFSNEQVLITSAKYQASINGIKLTINGFPHASQDNEMMVCAETTIWSIMEYFSHKYAAYKPILPNEIHKILSKYSFQRQAPSNGLNLLEICYALKQLGFGIRIYSNQSYGEDFKTILKTYIESGIPVVAAIENNLGIGHVVNIIGRTQTEVIKFSALPKINHENDIVISNFHDLHEDYVMIDDNHPAYRIAPLSNPSKHYAAYPEWNNCSITNFIVPLYPKIYLEADAAIALSKNFFLRINKQMKLVQNMHFSLRTFLTSSRSFKHAVAVDSKMNNIVKEKLLNTCMPKFVWITEYITEDNYNNNEVDGLILLDATERRDNDFLAFYLNTHYLSTEKGILQTIKDLPSQSFTSFLNLKLY